MTTREFEAKAAAVATRAYRAESTVAWSPERLRKKIWHLIAKSRGRTRGTFQQFGRVVAERLLAEDVFVPRTPRAPEPPRQLSLFNPIDERKLVREVLRATHRA